MAAGLRSATSAARDPVRDDLGVDLQLAHPAGDQLGVLGAEVDDEDGGPDGVGVSGRTVWTS